MFVFVTITAEATTFGDALLGRDVEIAPGESSLSDTWRVISGEVMIRGEGPFHLVPQGASDVAIQVYEQRLRGSGGGSRAYSIQIRGDRPMGSLIYGRSTNSFTFETTCGKGGSIWGATNFRGTAAGEYVRTQPNVTITYKVNGNMLEYRRTYSPTNYTHVVLQRVSAIGTNAADVQPVPAAGN